MIADFRLRIAQWMGFRPRRLGTGQHAALVFALAMIGSLRADEMTFAERLGWAKGTRAVILHVDDVGMSHASNLGAMESIEKGVASSF
jgi:hypothetical protein